MREVVGCSLRIQRRITSESLRRPLTLVVVQDSTLEASIKMMDDLQLTKGEGLLYGIHDEFAMFLSIFDRGQNAGTAHSIDRSRILTL